MLRHPNEQDHYVGLTTASGSPAEQTLSHDFVMNNTHQNPMPQGCLERALFSHHSRTMNRSALLDSSSVRVNLEQYDESEHGSEKTESEAERNYGCDEMQRAKTVHERVDIGFLCGKPASQIQRSNPNPRRIGPRTTRAYRKPGFPNPDRKWGKARLRLLQKGLENATEARSSIIRGQRRRNSC
ncbi:uncharacterized protein N7469_001952 [Penicillium citrinum]|uniref:Uncharacterized protein n=1 Tax=Penicillium citrinum TaxID=5077 RepID=A0A9W9P9B9_PENCI|nr:uncharacterized protein N7469_001952 [Penicillium citrinum]KAJ5240361.1 hypothetical protein N7469_001952 [Penicillium citrinum]